MRPTTQFEFLKELWLDRAITFLVLLALISAVAVTLFGAFSAMGQSNLSELKVGDRLIVNPSKQIVWDTNAHAALMPIIEQATDWPSVINNWMAGALAIIVALVGAWGKLRSNKADESGKIAKVLIQELEKIATGPEKENIASVARMNGISDALHEAVKANTPSVADAPTVRDYVKELVTEWPAKPVVEPPKPI